jgi:hypothetical protein
MSRPKGRSDNGSWAGLLGVASKSMFDMALKIKARFGQ